jgi:FAD/FMN-containing dehydrogenase
MDAGALQRRIDGIVVTAGAADYEATRQEMLWNELRPDRRPELIVRVASEADVVAAVQFAREHRIKIAVRGGGHSWCGAPLRDGGMLIDLARLKEVIVHPRTRTAMVQPVVSGRELSHRLAAHGLAFPYGHCSTVPLSGFVLSGGFGWNMGSWGPACFSLEAIDVVTAAGQLVRATEDQYADLLWAARGAGAGFFGVVTRFRLRLHPLPQRITTSTYVYPLACLGRLAAWMTEVSIALQPHVELALVVAGAAHGPVGEPACIVIATAFVETEAEATAALVPIERCPVLSECLAAERNQPTPFDALFDAMDRFFPQGHRYLADTFWSNDSAAQVLDGMKHVFETAPPKSLLLCVSPPPDGAPMPDAALSMAARTFVLCYAVWDDPANDAANQAWHRDTVVALEPVSVGHYIGESDIVATPARAARSFAPANWSRLQALRRQYDPEGLFHGYFDGA